MRPIVIGIAAVLALGLSTAAAQSPSWRPPTESQRCPSKWGANDERGSGNHMKPESVLRATRLIKTGEVISSATSSTPRCRSSAPGASTSTPSARS